MSPPKSYSIGSSAVTIFVSPLSFSLNAAAKVVDFPEPVGPETITIPLVSFIIFLKSSLTLSICISVSNCKADASLFKILRTIFSPCFPG